MQEKFVGKEKVSIFAFSKAMEMKFIRYCKVAFLRYKWWCILLLVIVAGLSIYESLRLPASPMWESKYEVRLINFRLNKEKPDNVLSEINNIDAPKWERWLDSLYGNNKDVKIKVDKTGKFTIRARKEDKVEAEQLAKEVYEILRDSVNRRGEEIRSEKKILYGQIVDNMMLEVDTMTVLSKADSLRLKGKEDMICECETILDYLGSDTSKTNNYVQVLNEGQCEEASRTVPRWLVIVMALAGAIVLMLVYIVLAGTANVLNERDD